MVKVKIEPPSPGTSSKKRKNSANAPKQAAKKAKVDPDDDAATARNKADDFYRYLYRRQCVRIKMHGDSTILGADVPDPPSHHILDLCISGNAYRHLDNDDHVVSKRLRKHVGLKEGKRPSDEQVEQMLPVVLLRVAGFNEQRMAEALAKVRKVPVDVAEKVLGPTNAKEGQHLGKIMTGIAKDKNNRPINPKWMAGGASQVQSFESWATAFGKQWFQKGGARSIKAAVAKLRAAKTWKEANQCLKATLLNVGEYTAAQGLCTLVFGVLRGDVTLLFGKDYTTEGPGSMLEWCGHGPGPATSVKEIFGEKRFKGNDATRDGIRELRDGAAAAFERLGLKFPYLGEAGGEGRELTCVDIEHSLCYYSRYLGIREHLSEDERLALWNYVRLKHPPKQPVEKLAIWKLKDLAKVTDKGAGLEGAKRQADAYFANPTKRGRAGD